VRGFFDSSQREEMIIRSLIVVMEGVGLGYIVADAIWVVVMIVVIRVMVGVIVGMVIWVAVVDLLGKGRAA
jgi:hypothetical protein